MSIGYIGLGNMGGALAKRLLRDFPVSVHDRSASATSALAEAGATVCGSPAAVAARCDTVFLCLPTSGHVREALFGPSGVLETARSGTLVVDQTTGDPVATRDMAAGLAERGVLFVDAPVSGGAAGAMAGTIAIMVGATDVDLARIRPILGAISPNIFHAGGVGAGHAMKLVNNLVSGAQRLLTFEAVALAARNGIDPARACEVLLAGGARNSFTEKFMLPRVVKGDLVSPFTLGLMEKDLALACALGAESGVPVAFGELTLELYRTAIAARGPQAEVNTAALVMDEQAGTAVVPPDPRVA